MAQWFSPEIFAAAIKLSRRISSKHREFPRQVDVIADCVKEHLQITRGKPVAVKIHPRIYEAQTFYGTLEDCDSHVDIYYDLNRNVCWRRFIITKEFCQLLYRCPSDNHLASSAAAIDSLLSQILAGAATDAAVASEHAAVVMAIEVLLPHSERSNVDNMISKGADHQAIAKKYRIPAQMVAYYLQPGYISHMDKASKCADEAED